MEIQETSIPEVKVLVPRKHEDARGFLAEVWNRRRFAEQDLELDFVQDNQSLSTEKGIVRGLHFQAPPCAQDKLVRVVRGSVWDVAVDLRRSSPTFGRHVAVELSAANFRQLLVPKGFAHGFATLEPMTEVLYKVSAYYSPEHDTGIRWDDPDLAIDWPVGPEKAVLSEKDRNLPRLADAPRLFD